MQRLFEGTPKKHPTFKRILCVWEEKQLKPKKLYRYISASDYDGLTYLQPKFTYRDSIIYERNVAMVDSSDIALFYFDTSNEEFTNVKQLYLYAEGQKKLIMNLYKEK